MCPQKVYVLGVGVLVARVIVYHLTGLNLIRQVSAI